MKTGSNIPVFAAILFVLLGAAACKKENKSVQVNITFEPMVATSGDPVKIKGSGFTGATAVTFGGTNAKSFNVVSDSIIMAVVNATASGNVSVTSPSGNVTATGFTYYTPGSFSLTGSVVYGVLGTWPGTDSSGYITSQALATTEAVTIRQINKYDEKIYSRPENALNYDYVDSAGYVALVGVTFEPRAATGAGPGTARNGNTMASVPVSAWSFVSSTGYSVHPVFAKITDTMVYIPTQGLGSGSYNSISGSGTLKNNKLTLKYGMHYRGYSKTAVFTSQ